MKKVFVLCFLGLAIFALNSGCKKSASPSKNKTQGTSDPVKEGEKLVKEKGCLTCHTIDGKKLVGPTFKGMYGKKETVLTNGKERTITVDDAYIKKSIKEPKADITKGYPPSMVLTQPVNDQEIESIIAYLKTLK